jgi:hypothetical protein
VEEFHKVTNVMAHGKALGPNGIVIKFYVRFSRISGIDWFNMIMNSKLGDFLRVSLRG